MKKIKLLVAGLFLLVATASFATPVQLGLPGTNLPADPTVAGLRFNLIWGKNDSVKGVDLGLLALMETKKMHGLQLAWGATYTTQSFSGFAGSFVNIHTGTAKGGMVGLVNYTKDMKGAQGGFVNVSERMQGLQWGFVNLNLEGSNINNGFVNANMKDSTVNFGFVNFTKGASQVDYGFVNYAGHASTQLGFVNVTNDLQGIQVGFLNFARNGFLPIFPFFNIDGRLWF